MKKKIISVLLALMTVSGTAAIPASAAEAEAVAAASDSEAVKAGIDEKDASESGVDLKGTASFNFYAQDYSALGRVVNSYLSEKSDGTLERVEYLPETNELIYEVYSADGKTKKRSGSISMELPLFGGFFSGSNYNYVVFGKENSAHNNNAEVMRVVKYSKDWKKQSAVSVKGANTEIPFYSGSLRMTEENGKLCIHTCHKMYGSHQGNMTYVINESNMKIIDEKYDVSDFSNGYVSHSFNQFVKIDNDDLYRVDHGDACPRSITLTKARLSEKINTVSTCEPVSLSNTGASGNNNTGVSVGGFELSSDKCVIAFNGVDFSIQKADPLGKRDIYLSVTTKDLTSTKTINITNCLNKSNISVSTPQLVNVNDNRFLIMWEETNTNKKTVVTKIASADTSGDIDDVKIGDIVSTNYLLSDCQPILCSDGAVRWYTSVAGSPVLYTVNPSKLSQSSSSTVQSLEVDIPVTLEIGDTYEVPKYMLYRSNMKSKSGSAAFLKSVDSNYVVTAKEQCTGELYFGNNYDGLFTYKFTITAPVPKPGAPTLSLINQATDLKASWSSVDLAERYVVYYRFDTQSAWSQISTSLTSISIPNAEPGKLCYVKVQSIGKNNAEGECSAIKNITYIPQTKPLITLNNKPNGIRAEWQAIDGTESYMVYYRQTGVSSWSSVKTANNYYTLTDITPGTSYSIKVQPIYKDSKGVMSAVSSLTYISQIKPTVTLVNKSNGICAEWNEIADATKYVVSYKATSDSSWTNLETTNLYYTLTGITPATEYSVSVRPVFGSSNGLSSTTVKLVYAPQVKTTVTISNKSTGIRADWRTITGATKYIVSYKKTSDSSWTDKETSNLHYLISGIEAGTGYSFRVTPVFGNTNGLYSTVVNMTYIPQVKPVVTLSNKPYGIRAEWQEIDGATKYIVYYKQSDASSWSSTETTNLYYPLITGISTGKSYSFQIKPVFGTSNGLYSAVTKLTYIPQIKPTVSLSNKSGEILVEWDEVSGATKYIVYYKQTDESIWSSKETTNTYFSALNLKAGTNYSFQIQPVFGSLYGSCSTIRQLTYIPQVKPNVTPTNQANGIRVSWDAVAGATKYRIFYKKTGDSSWTSVQTSNCYYTYMNTAKGTSYSFQIQPIFEYNYGLYSTVSTITFR